MSPVSAEVAAAAAQTSYDFSGTGNGVTPPAMLAHVVMYANDLERVRDWWLKMLGARLQFADKTGQLSLISYDEEHHRIGFINRNKPGEHPKESTLVHIAFTYPSLPALLDAYRQRLRQHGLKPFWNVNHGPTISQYYKDPEGNVIEMQVDILADAAEADDFLRSEPFERNPIGVDFDPEHLIRRLQAGEPPENFFERADIGVRGFDSVPSE